MASPRLPYKHRPANHSYHNYGVAKENFTYSRAGRCSVCGRDEIPVIRFSKSPVGPGHCRLCMTEGIKTIDEVGKSLGLDVSGIPAIDPPPIQSVWIVRRRTFNILGIANGAEFRHPKTLILDSPNIFRPLDDLRVDVVIQMWASSWAERGLQGRHHVVREKPDKLLEEQRFSVQLPQEYTEGVIELQVVG